MVDKIVIRKEVAAKFNEYDNKDKALSRKYYVYALCSKNEDNSLSPFYIGKGEGDRVWAHEDGEKAEQERMRKELSASDYAEALAELSKKYKKIGELGPDNIEKIIIKWGLTEAEAFMAESALINVFKMDNLAFVSGSDYLTNDQNGHASPVEKENGVGTCVRTVEKFYEDICKDPVFLNDLDGGILLRNINNGYRKCMELPEGEQKDAIREVTNGFWREGKEKGIHYVFAVYNGKIKGVYTRKRFDDPVQINRFDRKNNNYYVIDVDGPEYPSARSAKLESTIKDIDIATIIHDEIICNGIPLNCSNDKEKLYSRLSSFAQEAFKKYRGELKTNETYDNELKKYIERIYYNLEEISVDDPNYEKYTDYINRLLLIRKTDGSTEPVFKPKMTFVIVR